jgi:hypothetical protein
MDLPVLQRTTKNDPYIFDEAIAVAQYVKDFSWLISLIFWYYIWPQNNIIGKHVPSQNFDVCQFVTLTEGYQVFQKQYKENGVQRALSAATEMLTIFKENLNFKALKRIGHLKVIFAIKLMKKQS